MNNYKNTAKKVTLLYEYESNIKELRELQSKVQTYFILF